MRRFVLVVGLVVVVVMLSGLTLAASAKFDRPSRSVSVERVIDAPRDRVWATVTDFASYEEWNPYVTSASGAASEGGELRLRVETPGSSAEDVTVRVLTARFERKLRWEDRFVLPGLRDEEVTIRVLKLTPGRVRLFETVRMEGLIAPFADLEATKRGLELMAAALERRAEAAS